MKQAVHPFWIASRIAFCCLIATSPSQAQIVPDTTLPNNSSATTQGNISTITGGTVAGSNLFHSFDVFSVPTGNTAYFNNAIDIQNIISRVTGSSISNIDGLIRANGSANLFLINPNGIIFGPNASLNIGGSFLASTASSLNFADGKQFSATNPQATPLLTVSVPIGLQFGGTAGSILNKSTVTSIDTSGVEAVGLQVEPGKTLALVGSDVVLKGGYLTAQEGRIELGSVAGSGQVSLKPTEKGWALGYEGVQNFKDIQLSQAATVNASGAGGGDIQLQGKSVILTDGSQIVSLTLSSEPGGNLTVNASDSVELSGRLSSASGEQPSSLSTLTVAAGKAGDININTGKLIVQNQAYISTETGSTGRGGNLTAIAPVAVDLTDGFLSTQTSGMGNAGDLMIETGQLIVRDGGQVFASSSDRGNGGDIRVNASNAVNLFGVNPTTGFSSGLLARTSGGGQGGNITVNTHNFRVANGALVDALTTAKGNAGNVTVTTNTFEAVNGGQVLTITRSSGNAGNISLNALDSVTISGSDPTFTERFTRFGQSKVDNEGSASGLFANTAQGSTGSGGDVTIKTRQLNVNDGARVTVSSLGTGKAGNFIIDPDLVKLDRGTLTAETQSGEGGNITIFGGSIQLGNNSRISTKARGNGNGGNININADTLVGLENSDIVANAYAGNGGKVKITTQGIFGFQLAKKETPLTSDITASSELGINGVVQINTPDVDPSLGIVTLPVELVDVTGLIAQRCPAGGGNVARGSSEFIVTGRGGLPPNTREALASEPALADLGTPVPSQEHRASAAISTNPISSEPAPIVAATGWVIGDNGQVVLTAQAPTVTPDIPWLKPTTCHAS